MSDLGDALGRDQGRAPVPPGRSAPAPPLAPAPLTAPPATLTSPAAPNGAQSPAAQSPAGQGPAEQSQVGSVARAELRRRRDALAEQVTELHWDLGGLAFEMAIRDHFRLDVLVRRAAILQERDAELAEVERLLRIEDGSELGSCPQCGAPHSRGAVFCWQCGVALMARAPDPGNAAADASTVVMDALLQPRGDGTAPAPARAPIAGDGAGPGTPPHAGSAPEL